MKRYISILILLLLPVFSLAQSDTDKDQQDLYSLLFVRKLPEAKIFIDSRFLKSESRSRQIIGYVYLILYYKINDEQDGNDQLLKTLQKAQDIAKETGNEIDEAYVEYANTIYYQKINKWDLYIKSLQKSISIFKKRPHENFMLTLLYYSKLMNTEANPLENRNVTDYTLALKYALQSKNKFLISSGYNFLGGFYAYQNNTAKKYKDSAITAFNQSLKIAQQVQNSYVSKKLQFFYYTNIGSIYTNDREYSKALANYNKGLQLYNNDKDKFYLWSLFNNIGYTYALMQDNNLALKYYLKAESMNADKQITDKYKVKLYLNISEAYEKLRMLDKALEYEKKCKETIIALDKRLYDDNSKSLDTFYQTEQEKNILKEKNIAYKKYEMWYISAIISTVLGLILLFFTLDYRKKLNKRTTSLLESEKEKLHMENELSIMKQEQLQRQALATSIQLQHKNTFINELKVNMPKDKKLNHLLKDEQLIDNNFNTIRDIIQETHPNFFKRLNELAKNRLTNLDLKYAAYIYLNMDNMQISTALKVDPKTVSVTKYRLKQKLGVGKGQDLNTFIRTMKY
ncbi:tetratricopeptide repeat-containing protein [Chryseobacterium lactis]|uniref:Tetratricopeptide repeat protein n=1 Tax=Chryseobacterium lactis TaxID=1241981 RepID=A0A3G6RNI2_CHRLC|nr:hypothetical protein [Chryseobacterium lactis]AZA83290.1 tetratricopeptide repeat protein [Chryseobacterium lactis]AZB03674.1 tetratricopeptide repeat protein [Chryseobacterium lactis]PNW11116.1 tetratricopeptide repeat-containing protein [Chryseobacterium lactis]